MAIHGTGFPSRRVVAVGYKHLSLDALMPRLEAWRRHKVLFDFQFLPSVSEKPWALPNVQNRSRTICPVSNSSTARAWG